MRVCLIKGVGVREHSQRFWERFSDLTARASWELKNLQSYGLAVWQLHLEDPTKNARCTGVSTVVGINYVSSRWRPQPAGRLSQENKNVNKAN